MQEIAVFAIVAVAMAYVVRVVVDRLRGGKVPRDACAGGCGSCRRCR